MDPNVTDDYGNTPLHLAAESGIFEIVRWLCEKRRAAITVVNNDGETPLSIASSLRYEEIANYLRIRGRMLCERLGG
tara:strand:+ start:753 stop:983 length:231 start_codon:yes stop_codon:yes gene_type:complete